MDARERSLKNAALGKYLNGFASCGLGLSLPFLSTKHPYIASFIGVGLLILGCFFLTIARVRVEGKALQYQRWSRWHSIPYSEIVECGEDGEYGYVKTRQYIFPWGSLYFLRPHSSDSLFGWDKETIKAIRTKANI
jgi:hypothetical protein